MTSEENLVGLMAVNRDVIGQAETWDRSDRVLLDMDSSESPVHGLVTTARSRRHRMSTGAQVRWRIMRLTNDGQIGNVSLEILDDSLAEDSPGRVSSLLSFSDGYHVGRIHVDQGRED
jgi:hypothetical protein